MLLNSNVILQMGFSLELGKTFSQIGNIPGNIIENTHKNDITALISSKSSDLLVFPTHETNTIIRRKYSYIPRESLNKYKSYIKENHDGKTILPSCLIKDNKVLVSTSASGSVFRLAESIKGDYQREITKGLIVFENKYKKKLKMLEKSDNIFLDNKSYEKYVTLIQNFNNLENHINTTDNKIKLKKADYEEQVLIVRDILSKEKYLAPNFFLNSSIAFRLIIDSTGKAKELGNFFVPITYEAIYCMVELQVFSRILKFNSTLLNTNILRDLYDKYLWIKLGVTTDIFGFAWTIDPRAVLGFFESMSSKKKIPKVQIVLMILKALVRALSFTIKREQMVFFFTFDFYTLGFSVSAFFFPLKYSAYIDHQGKKEGVEIKSIDSPQLTYF
jgi:hypothetical protein